MSDKLFESPNKYIYMTYNKNIPDKVIKRWKNYNIDYTVDLSLDKDCIDFLEKNFNSNISNLFKGIFRGAHKADLWRLCKLYLNSGTYADVDLVPYFCIDDLDKNITFYSCLSIDGKGIFQALMVNFSKPKHPIFLVFLISFIINRPDKSHWIGPTFDMYNCIKYSLNVNKLYPDKKYEIDYLKIKIPIGSSTENIKIIDLYYFPDDVKYTIKLHQDNPHNDRFDIKINNNYLIVKRIDVDCGWGHNHIVDICFPCKTSFYFFKERIIGDDIVNCYVTHKNEKILDCRDAEYHNNGGSW